MKKFLNQVISAGYAMLREIIKKDIMMMLLVNIGVLRTRIVILISS